MIMVSPTALITKPLLIERSRHKDPADISSSEVKRPSEENLSWFPYWHKVR